MAAKKKAKKSVKKKTSKKTTKKKTTRKSPSKSSKKKRAPVAHKSRKSSRPLAITIIAILGFIEAAVVLLSGLGLLFGSSALESVLSSSGLTAGLASGAGAFLILLGVLILWIAKALWDLKNWARIVTLIFAILAVIGAITSVSSGTSLAVVDLLVNFLIVYFLGFHKPTKAAFKR